MFHRYGKQSKYLKRKSLKDLTAVQTPKQLLGDDKRQDLLNKIKASAALSPNRFEPLCMSLIHNLINHCQSLPETMNSYYSMPGGVLDYALNRTEAALQLFSQYLVVEHDELSDEQKLWSYALFSAAILKGIGKLHIDYQVGLFDVNGEYIKSWSPLLESISSVGSYYHYEIQGETDDALRKRLNLLLARSLMPTDGFSWIASNQAVLTAWLALLNEDWESAGTLGAILIRADAIAIQRYISDFMVQSQLGKGGRVGRISTFVDKSSETVFDKEAIGVAFIQWLMQALEQGDLLINKAPLFIVPGGMLMSSDIFKLFVREHPAFKNWQAIQHGFLSLGLHSVMPDGGIESRFEQAHTQQMVSGVVLEKYAVALPEQVNIHHLNTGKVSQISATELINKAQASNDFTQKAAGAPVSPLAHLNASGQWQQVNHTASDTLQPGRNPRG